MPLWHGAWPPHPEYLITPSLLPHFYALSLELKGISGGGAVDPERITRGVISLTSGDSRRGSLGSIFRFSRSVCVSGCSAGIK